MREIKKPLSKHLVDFEAEKMMITKIKLKIFAICSPISSLLSFVASSS